MRIDPKEIFREYEACVGYNDSIGLYDNVRCNEDFYIGRQWEGLNAPDLDKPVLNFLKRVCSYTVAMLVSDDIGIELRACPGDAQAQKQAKFLETEILRVIERTKTKALSRDMLRNCVVDGDGCFYWYFDPDARGASRVRGEIALELVDNTRVLFGNPFSADVQRQPFLLVVRREQAESVRERARRFGQRGADIRPDAGEAHGEERGYDAGDLVTVVLKLWKKKGKVCFCEVTRDAVVRPQTQTDTALYPVSFMNWERVRNSYHGQAVITGLIPNQIAVNKLWAMAIRQQHTLAFPKIFYDRMKIKEWTNRVGEAVGVTGNPNDAVATSFRAAGMSEQVLEIVDKTIAYTKEFMGASDAALGNVDPTNASAIIAVQKATSAPLELQRLAFYQFVEDYVRIIAELICAHYGPRRSTYTDEDGAEHTELVDFSAIDPGALSLTVEVGPSAYWSELTQIGTLDNLFAKGVISDALLYLESVPDGYIRNKQRLMRALRGRMDAPDGRQDRNTSETKGAAEDEMQ
ncbi:MAG: hypothetical protein VB021_05865 [Oscillospiraceae bacterium]|nr:hypothetical protein [Oscillospiraceae bacterium]